MSVFLVNLGGIARDLNFDIEKDKRILIFKRVFLFF